MLKFDLWIASPSRLPYAKDYDICCKACSAYNDEEDKRYCRRCKWKVAPITVEEIVQKRRKY